MSDLCLNGFWHSAIDNYLKQGKSFKEWVVKDFARQYGALVELREKPQRIEIPEFKVSSYHVTAIKEAKKEYEALSKFTKAEKIAYGTKIIKKELSLIRNIMTSHKKDLALLRTWGKEISTFANKSSKLGDIGTSLKEQYEEILKREGDMSYYEKELKKWENTSPIEEYNDRLESKKEDINYHEKEHENEVKRVASRNQWVKDLREILSEI